MTIKVAQIGCGHWGKNLARNFNALGALAAVADPNQATAHAESHGQPVLSFDEILGNPEIQAVSLASPAAMHAEMAEQALDAGKHVFVEKPLALTVASAERVIAKAKSVNRVLMVGHLMHYHPLFQALSGEVQAGRLGKLRRMSSIRHSLGKFRIEENVIWSFAPHDVAMILALAGREPYNVQSSQQSVLTVDVADHGTIEMEFAGGLVADISVSWLRPVKIQRLTVIGENGMAVLDDAEPDWQKKLAFYHHAIDRGGPVPVPHKAEPEYMNPPRQEPLLCECRHFLDCIANGRQPVSDGNEGLRVLKVLARTNHNVGSEAA